MSETQKTSLITAPQAATRLGISLARTYELARHDLLPAVRLGRSIRFDPTTVESFIASGGTTRECHDSIGPVKAEPQANDEAGAAP